MIDYQLSFLIAVVAFVYTVLLTEPHMLLNGVYIWLEGKLFVSKPWWKRSLFKIIIHCERCFAGQASLWLYFVVCTKYHLLQHIFFVAMTIFFVTLIRNLYYKYIQP